MANAEMTVNIHVEGLAQKVVDFLKLGPPRGLEFNECGYCLELFTDAEAFSASAHGPDCAWIAFARAVVGGLVVA